MSFGINNPQASLGVTQAAAWEDGSPGMAQQWPQPAGKLRLGAAVHKQLLAQEVNAELYLRLLCQFEPPAVLPFLQSHDSYRRVCLCVRTYCDNWGSDNGFISSAPQYNNIYAFAQMRFLQRIQQV